MGSPLVTPGRLCFVSVSQASRRTRERSEMSWWISVVEPSWVSISFGDLALADAWSPNHARMGWVMFQWPSGFGWTASFW